MQRQAVILLVAVVATASCPPLSPSAVRFRVAERLTAPLAAHHPSFAFLAEQADRRWTADQIVGDWSHIQSETAATFRSPDLAGSDTVHAIVVSLRPAIPSRNPPLLLWSDQPVLSPADFARNRRVLEPSSSTASTTVIRPESLQSDSPQPLRYLFIHLDDASALDETVEALALVDDRTMAASEAREVTRLSLGGESRDGFVMQSDTPLSFNIDAAANVELTFAVGLPEGSGAAARVIQSVAGDEAVLVDSSLLANTWQQHRVRVHEAQNTTLTFVATAATPSTIYWSVPQIHAPAPNDSPPNVVLVVVDALRADAITTASSAATPFFDKLASDSVVFAHAYAAASWTKPSIATLLTSLYPQTHQLGARFYSDALPDSVPSLQSLLAAAGFRTAMASGNPFSGALSNLDRGFDRTSLPRRADGSSFALSGEELNTIVFRWLADHRHDQFFLYVHYVDTHPPFAGGDPNASTRRQYNQAVTIADRSVGGLYAELERLGIGENTVFVVTADHGEAFGEHGQTGHGQSVYEEEIRVPLIVRSPTMGGGARVTEPVHLADVMPTILSATGVTRPPTLQGRALTTGRILAAGTSRVIVSRFVYPDDVDRPAGDRSEAIAIVDYPWKLIATDRGNQRGMELYKLDADPGERQNLAEREPDRVRLLTTVLDGFLRSQVSARASYLAAHAPGHVVRPMTPSRELQDQLRTLGYIK